MEVILVRHTSVAVPKGTCYGQTDVAVSDTFEQEAAETLRNLRRLAPVEAVFASPLTRARLLAEYCLPEIVVPSATTPQPSVTFDDRLLEMDMGDWEMKRFDDLHDPYAEAWYQDYLHLPTPNGESFPMQLARVSAFLDELRTHHYQRVAVFAHGGVLVCAGVYGGLFPVEESWSHLVPYGGIEQIDI